MKGVFMKIKEFFRKLYFEINKRDNSNSFVKKDFYILSDEEDMDNLEVGETIVSVTAKLQKI